MRWGGGKKCKKKLKIGKNTIIVEEKIHQKESETEKNIPKG